MCYSCSNVCPDKVYFAVQIYLLRLGLDKLNKADRMKKIMSGGMKFIMKRPPVFNTALRLAPLSNRMPRFLIYNKLNAWGNGREMPEFSEKSFNEMWKNGDVK